MNPTNSKEEVIQLLQSARDNANIFQPTVTDDELITLADKIILAYTNTQPSTKQLKAGFLI